MRRKWDASQTEVHLTALDRIIAHLHENQGRAYCDDCLSKILSITLRQAVQQKTFKLANDNRYERGLIVCSGCSRDQQIEHTQRLALAS
jgi:hypothetical protein